MVRQAPEKPLNTRRAAIVILAGAIIISVVTCSGPATAPPQTFTADEKSLARHYNAPNWFRDAKLGIYFHWGP